MARPRKDRPTEQAEEPMAEPSTEVSPIVAPTADQDDHTADTAIARAAERASGF